MARFIGYVQGMKGEASRLGSENSGISATARGWEIGARVAIQTVGGEDILTVRIDGGSNGQKAGRCLGEWKRDEQGRPSKSGKTTLIATTEGNQPVAPGVMMGLNIYRK